jgi:putative peptidoglycan lipid II flippase
LKKGFHWQPTLHVNKEFRKAFLALIIPSFLNSIVGQVNMFVDKTFASGTIEGAVTYLNNASLLVSIPNAIYATTIAAIIFTLLSEQVDNPAKFQNTFFMGIEISLLTLLPIAAGLLVVGDSALSFIYERGAFTSEDTQSTYLALLFYLPLIVTQGLQFIVSKSMYAKGRTAIIFRISATTIIVNIILNYFLVQSMGYPGLALSSSIVAVYYLAVSSIVVYKDFEKSEIKKLTSLVLRSLPPTIIMVIPLYLLQRIGWFSELYSLWKLAILVPLGAILYAVSLRVFYREGFNRLLEMVRKKKKK